MSAKSAILSKIRTSLGATANDGHRLSAVASRLGAPPRGVIPARGQLPERDRIALFIDAAEAAGATVETIAAYDALPESVAAYLRARNLTAAIRMGADRNLDIADWDSEKALEVKTGPSDGNDIAGLSHAFAGVAETGTLALLSGPDNPTTLNFLPEYHLVVIRTADIYGDMETVWDRLRTRYGKGTMNRVMNFVTGPSRSADIEQTILLGAHGPRALHIIVVDTESNP